MRLILFDIDGTLISTQSVGTRAVNRTFADLYGTLNIAHGLSLAGRTDRELFAELLVKAGIIAPSTSYRHPEIDRSIQSYLNYLQDELLRPPSPALLPGVATLLAELEKLVQTNAVRLGILTGNIQRGAWIKLQHARIANHFQIGAFGCDHHDRSALLPWAVTRARTAFGHPWQNHEVTLIGDALGDIRCARAHNARIIAVGTGPTPAAVLQAEAPDAFFADLSPTSAALAAILG